jgi:hypothetical protein
MPPKNPLGSTCMATALPFGTGAAAADFPTAWNTFTNELQKLGETIVTRLPERLRADPQTQQEVGRLLLESLAPGVIEAISSDVDHPVFLPFLNATLNIGQPNADTMYTRAIICGDGVYRLRGTRGSVRYVRIAQFPPLVTEVKFGSHKAGPNPLQALGTHDFDKLHLEQEGWFDVILSPSRPRGYTGDWWELNSKSGALVLRQVMSDWGKERDARIVIERLDKPVRRARLSAEALEARLRGITHGVGIMALSLMTHVEDMRNEGYLNSVKIMQTPGALQGQFYYEGPFEITPDEALIVEAKVPKKCLYFSAILTNDIYETIDWVNNQSSLNDSQAHVNSDGVVRFVVSVKDPGVLNWLDTAGHLSGALQGRWTECDTNPIPTVTKVPFSEIRNALPADTPVVTPEERDRIVRERRAQFLMRPYW